MKHSTLACLSLVTVFSANTYADVKLPEKITQGSLIVGYTQPTHKITYNKEAITVLDDGSFVFGVGRDAPKSIVIEEQTAEGKIVSHQVDVTQREYNIQRIEGVPKSKVTPPESELDRIRKETNMVKKARTKTFTHPHFKNTFQWPVEGRVTGVYGSQRFYNGTPSRPHYGIDIAAPTGTIVKAPASGTVTLTHEDMYFSGGTLIVDHGYGVSSTFIHLSEILVQNGDVVKQGEPIAKVGSTGRSTGPHLDWRINWYKVRLDPNLLLPPKK